jgi:hypothetical protein
MNATGIAEVRQKMKVIPESIREWEYIGESWCRNKI